MSRILLLLPVLAVSATACFSAGGGASTPSPPQRQSIAGTDLTQHSVPLEEIVFDTFDGFSIPLSEITEPILLSLRNAIRPLNNPQYDDVSVGDPWLKNADLIIGYESAGVAYAYPIRILNFHEIVNDEIDGVPVLVSYCPLCRSGVVYSRTLEGRELTFGNTSALFESDLVMFDTETRSYWWQVAGTAVVGEMTGQRLQALPSLTTTWIQWRELHPDTLVLSRPVFFDINYSFDPFQNFSETVNAGDFPFPVSEAVNDGRLAAADEVLGIIVNGASRAYPLRLLGDTAVNDRVGGEPIVVFSSADGPSGTAYRPRAASQDLTFDAVEGVFRDRETGSDWGMDGRAVAGPLAGSRLDGVPSRYTFWFAYVAAFPITDVFVP